MTELPQWLTNLLPPPKDHVLLSKSADTWIVNDNDIYSSSIKTFSTLAEAHSYLRNNNLDFEIDENIEGEDSLFLSYPSERSRLYTLVLGSSDKNRLMRLQSDFKDSLDAATAYLADPLNFLSAYYFVDQHPAFWTYDPDHPWFWTTSGYCAKLYQCPYSADDGSLVFELEAGSHVESTEDIEGAPRAFTYHYHDYRLDAVGNSFEEAIVDLASLVHKFFSAEGIERENVDHEVPDWIETVRNRAKEVDEYLASEAE
jgi:hypothetical protein